ncbi:TRZ/ATZ family hydrolase [Rugosimonospora africana]|uniref:TRZ/ATZ family hydrolase n=2 Tax=Rugosimonospora africana TaxID=556532 RepID=A0A8J3VS92_9ACTN|nr:TRZ/ATZ family hydrolase [Rugosimonospora africana]
MASNRDAPILIKNATVVTGDADLGVIDGGDVLVVGECIDQVAPGIVVDGAAVIDATDMIAMPGFVDSHRHTWEASFRALGADWDVQQYLTGILGLTRYMRPYDTYNGILLGALEALDAGVTTLLDWSHCVETPEHTDAAVQALRDSGLRAVFAHGGGHSMWNFPSDVPHTGDVRRVRTQHFSDNNGARNLVTMALAVRGPEFSTMPVAEGDWLLAAELDLPITVHLGAMEQGRGRPVAALHERGMTGPGVTYVHGNLLGDDELTIIADTGGSTSVAATVEMELHLGFPATGRMLRHGIRPSLSVDVPAAASGDMFNVMRTTYQIERALQFQPDEFPRAPVSVKDVFDFATANGAYTLGLEHVTGSLTPGKKADLVLLDAHDLALSPINNALGAIVQNAHAGHVDSVFVNGRAIKRGGRLLHPDIDAVRRRASQTRDDVFERAAADPTLGTPRIGGDWRPLQQDTDPD